MIVIIIVALVVFGPARLPEIMRQAGKALRSFQAESHKAMAELKDAVDTTEVNADIKAALAIDTVEPAATNAPTAAPIATAAAVVDVAKTTGTKAAPAKKKAAATAKKKAAPATKKKAVPAKKKTAMPAKKKTAMPAKKKATATKKPARASSEAGYPATEDT